MEPLEPQHILYGCMAVFICCCFCLFLMQVSSRQMLACRHEIAELLQKYIKEEGRARQRHFFLQGVDNLQVWKLGGKSQGLAYKVPHEVLYQDKIDLGKYFTDEELAAYKVGVEVYGKDERTAWIAADFKVSASSEPAPAGV